MSALRCFLAATCIAAAAASDAAVIVAPVSGSVSSHNGPHTIEHTFDQSGLSVGYAAGSSDFDAFLALDPLHAAAGVNGWLSFTGDVTPVARFDLGAATTIDAMALWVGDAYPPAFADVLGSLDGVLFFPLLDDVPIVSFGLGVDTPAQRLDWAAQAMRFVELRLTCKPSDTACSIGEVAFRSDGITIPEPSPALLLGAAGAALLLRRARPGRRVA